MSIEVPVSEGDEARSVSQEELGQGKKIIVVSDMYQLVPQVSSLKTPKMFDSLTKLFEEKNIN